MGEQQFHMPMNASGSIHQGEFGERLRKTILETNYSEKSRATVVENALVAANRAVFSQHVVAIEAQDMTRVDLKSSDNFDDDDDDDDDSDGEIGDNDIDDSVFIAENDLTIDDDQNDDDDDDDDDDSDSDVKFHQMKNPYDNRQVYNNILKLYRHNTMGSCLDELGALH